MNYKTILIKHIRNYGNRKKIKNYMNRTSPFTIFGIIQGLFVLMFISSFFTAIWFTWSITWKLGLTGIIGTLLIRFIDLIIVYALDKTFERECNKTISIKNNQK